ncbi:MAG: cohesin domain-containing protein [Candidatus Jorgensenbacteria bacterium]|nr:cohesin domain-containing protein [Candidatus Jorgensenbacteria bacterium]
MKRFFLFLSIIIGTFALMLARADAASLRLSPSAGSFTVGSTFDVSVFLDTEGESVNALEVFINFPPDKLQLVSPTTGQSIISVWTGQPRFNNATGRVELQGGLPGGINVSNGLITTLTFRAKAVGSATVRFLDGSRVLLNDGLGTDALENTGSGVYQLLLPAPLGPSVVSGSHPVQSRWYAQGSVELLWAPNVEVGGYSYILNDEPIDIPDDISEGLRTSVVYRNVEDGTKYFHIKAHREGRWGGVTHFAVNVDTVPPAEFPVQIIPDARTSRTQPVIQFITTDAYSGLDHYELKIVPLSRTAHAADFEDQTLFIEVQSPYVVPELTLGDYDVIVRALDKAGNVREVTKRLQVVTAALRFVSGEGLVIGGAVTVPWGWVWTITLLLLGTLLFVAYRVRFTHENHQVRLSLKELPPHLRKQIEELKQVRKRYGKSLMLFALLIPFVMGYPTAHAQQATGVELAPPFVTSISRDISDEDIFYAGGKVDISGAEVILYLQNLRTGETESHVVVADRRGDWFYRHGAFLGSGNYLLWAQSRFGDATSPPGPQIQLAVRPTAIQFGASRLSYESLYLIILLILLFATAGLTGYIVYHGLHAREKRKLLTKEIREAEESVRRGFAVLRRDIEAELAVIKRAKMKSELKSEEQARETQLLKDLEWAEKYVGKEVWDIDRAS